MTAALLALFFVAVLQGPRHILHVANSGADSLTCGQINSPCRSISRAIANAEPQDKIVVEPGRYGDADGDGSLNHPGDEAGPTSGCSCVLNVNKPVQIESRDGSANTIIDSPGGLN